MSAAGKLLLAPLALLLIGARGYETRPWTLILLPSDDVGGQDMALTEGGIVTRSPVVQAPQATLRTPVELSIASIEQSLPAGTVLRYVTVGGDAAERLEPIPEAYCAVPPANAGMALRTVLEVSAFGLFRGLNRSAPFSTHCFIDSDGDGRFDIAFLSGARREADLQPLDVGPLDATFERNRPVEGISEARISFAGANRRGTRLSFSFEVAGPDGRKVQGETRARVEVADLPETISIQGAEIEVRSYDASRRAVQLRLVRPMGAGGFGFTPPPQIIYVYVPRR